VVSLDKADPSKIDLGRFDVTGVYDNMTIKKPMSILPQIALLVL